MFQLSKITRHIPQVGYDDGTMPAGYCDPHNKDYPCAAGKSYHGRG